MICWLSVRAVGQEPIQTRLCSAAFAALVVICSYLTVVYPNLIYVALWIIVVPGSLIASLGVFRIVIRWKDRAEL